MKPQVIKIFITLIENQFQAKVLVFRSDNAKLYAFHHVEEYFYKKGIVYETSFRYTLL